jgi:hypothetical protein
MLMTGIRVKFKVVSQRTRYTFDTYGLPASIKRSAITAFWHVNSP